MYLIVGLGNPGPKYQFTRHNIGFLAVDFFAERETLNLSSKWQSEFCKGKINSADFVIQKPLTYMNLSGQSVQGASSFFKIPPANVLVIQDDVDMPFGAIRFQKNRSAGGHNGIKDIIEKLGTQDFLRLKVGVGRPTRGDVKDYVLENFSKAEQKQLPDLLIDLYNSLYSFVTKGFEKSASSHNRKIWNPGEES